MNLGIIIGRFQVPELHIGHKELINYVKSKHNQVLILLGVSETINTKKNPLDYITREKMIKSEFPDVAVSPLPDRPTDEEWSKNVDRLARMTCPIGEITIYGGRDSFIPHYHGKFKTKEIDLNQSDSGTNVREIAADKILVSADFRAGMIYAAYNQYSRIHPCVDIAVYDDKKGILLGRKANSNLWQLPGGFVDLEDNNLEAAAIRELKEETSIIGDSLKYICSSFVNDWRYKSKEDGKILSTLFFCGNYDGEIQALDDLEEVKWFNLKKLDNKVVHPVHRDLVDKVFEYVYSKKRNIYYE